MLGGGGAKGAAHIGVLRVLEEMNIPIDCVAGTSMGALVGATFAAGVAPEVIESQVLAVDWAVTVGTAGDRDKMSIRRKLESQPYTNSLDLGYTNGALRGAGGFLNTQDIDDLLRTLVAGARNVQDFNALPIPFRAVATDMVSGSMVVLRDGDLSVAMRASMAVPGAFTPVVRDGQVLADGGQMRNVPVDIARELCGDVIIAVSLETPPPTAEDLSSSLALAARSLDVMIDANSRAQLATLTDRDVSIVVPMGDIGSGSFERVPDAIPLGRAAALAKSTELARYSVTPEEYRTWRARVSRDYREPQRVADVSVVGLDRVDPEYVQEAIVATRPDAEVTPVDIASDAARIYALGAFQEVRYRVVDTPDRPRVEFIPVEKSWGPNFVDLDLGLGWGSEGDQSFILRAEHRRAWITSLGGEWHNVVQIGTDAEFGTALYLPLEVRQRYFVEPFLRYNRYYEDIFFDGDRVAEYDFEEAYGQVDLGLNLGKRAELRAGIRQSWNEATLETGPRELFPERGSVHESDLVLQARYDTRDTVGLPERGELFVANYLSSESWLGGDESYGMAEGLALVVLPLRGDTLNLFAGGGIDASGELPTYRRYRIGGIMSFPGLQRQQVRGDNYWLVGSNYNWRLADIQQLFNQALYAGLRLTSGHVGGRIDEDNEDLLTGLAVTLSGRTPIGPFLVSLGGVDNNSWALQLAIGRPIREGSIFDEIW
ncbi:MAG: patatin-like phospholipase family protein [Halieaceae bacterium]|nr:patatin-like phospholipase family protein [Halieaceae bacterium]